MGGAVLITGGAGFIGRRLASRLLGSGRRVRVLDALIPQVHPDRSPPDDLDPRVDLRVGDVRDAAAVRDAIQGVDAVVHLAAEVGVGQSMYDIARYVGANDLGTATVLEAIVERPVRRLIVASSMSVYGEGLYRSVDGRSFDAVERDDRASGWDPTDEAGRPLTPVPTPETKRPALASVYAVTKYAQERMALCVAKAYGIEACALRLWNAYGPGQALSNPYTGVLAIFAARLSNGARPLVFEDGEQRRDFVHVEDVAAAFEAALTAPDVDGVYNIGSGEDRTIAAVARDLARVMGLAHIAPDILQRGRVGDVRHNIPDISRARAALGFAPRVAFEDGLTELAHWVSGRTAVDRVEGARAELERRGLVA